MCLYVFVFLGVSDIIWFRNNIIYGSEITGSEIVGSEHIWFLSVLNMLF